ncbi:hypothetical protein CGRA01v4_06923 [Colletotrichum graminicola]|nr:hypothetical protein CGRA01v4_06923 [Colletotrichum graminicola]
MVLLFLLWYLRQAEEGVRGLDQAAYANKVALRTRPGMFPLSPSLILPTSTPANQCCDSNSKLHKRQSMKVFGRPGPHLALFPS